MISGEFFLRFSGAGGGSLGRRLSFLVTVGLLSKMSETRRSRYFQPTKFGSKLKLITNDLNIPFVNSIDSFSNSKLFFFSSSCWRRPSLSSTFLFYDLRNWDELNLIETARTENKYLIPTKYHTSNSIFAVFFSFSHSLLMISI